MRMRAATTQFGIALAVFLAFPVLPARTEPIDKPYRSWTLDEAVEVLTRSPWGRQETFTRVLGGIGSGLLGEKEILDTFFVRLLSARPVREAYARVQQIQAGYDRLDKAARRRIDATLAPVLDLDADRWIVVTVSFRSNDHATQLRIKQFFETQTTDSLKTSAHLSTDRIPQIELAAYFPPVDEAVGAKFVFPRRIGGEPAVTCDDESVTFELEIPGLRQELRVGFPVAKMIVKGELVL